jgi:ABC-type polar amino acid transport system ATPase subunit
VRLIVEARGVHKHFGALHVLKGVDLAVAERELVFVIGPSGSGKSTLLRCLNRLEEPSSGTIVVDGVDLLDPRIDINHARQRIGMVFQSFNLYPHMTALGNVTLALRKVQGLPRAEAQAQGMAALTRVGLGSGAAAGTTVAVGAGCAARTGAGAPDGSLITVPASSGLLGSSPFMAAICATETPATAARPDSVSPQRTV